jgi:hypothetical protein
MVLVGKAQMPIPAGGLIHTFNLKHASEPFQGKLKDYTWQAPDVSAWKIVLLWAIIVLMAKWVHKITG